MQSTSPAHTPPGSARQNTKVSVACQPCKTRKTKCSGQPGPCASCLKHKTACEFDETLDSRRKQTRKRQIDDFARDRKRLELVLASLRNGTPAHLIELIYRIRSDAPLDELESWLQEREASDGRGPQVASLLPPLSLRERMRRPRARDDDDSPRRKAIPLDLLVSVPTIDVPAAPWTAVTHDRQFVAHLITLYAIWWHPVAPSFDLDLFLRGMQSRDLASPFCSPILVNAVLAMACVMADDISSYNVQGDRFHMAKRFYDEARRLIDLDGGRPLLTTVQALHTLSTLSLTLGYTWSGQLIASMASLMCQELELPHPPSSDITSDDDEGPPDAHDGELETAQLATAWSVYYLEQMLAGSLRQTSAATRPAISMQQPTRCSNSTWYPYPRANRAVPSHNACVQVQLCNLACIQEHINYTLFNKLNAGYPLSDRVIASAIRPLMEELHTWREAWPPCLAATDNKLPHVLLLHIWYHVTVLSVVLRQLELRSGIGAAELAEARIASLEAAVAMTELLETYESTWTLDYLPTHPSLHAALALGRLLQERSHDRHVHLQLVAVRALGALATRFPTSSSIVGRFVRQYAKQRLDMPDAVAAALAQVESLSRRWTERFTPDSAPALDSIHGQKLGSTQTTQFSPADLYPVLQRSVGASVEASPESR